MTERFDTIVVGLGALGSATAWDLARRGSARSSGLERFELGHSRGASHDTSRILRHSYHTPSYVRLTQEAYVDWARLEQDSGEELVTTVGGLDLFPPPPMVNSRRSARSTTPSRSTRSASPTTCSTPPRSMRAGRSSGCRTARSCCTRPMRRSSRQRAGRG